MAFLKILIYPHPTLMRKSSPVKKIQQATVHLLDDMLEIMRGASGIGLSAPQIGRSTRVIIVSDASEFEAEQMENAENYQSQASEKMPVIEMINPVIEKSAGTAFASEGCLSIPGFTAKVKRKKDLTVRWLNRSGEKNRAEFHGLTARIIQHEIDHLDGVLFVDRLSRLKKEMMLKKIGKAFAPENKGGK